jgi:hypothetical protein
VFALALAVLGIASPVLHAADGGGIQWVSRLPDGEVTRFEILPAAGGQSVQITVTAGAEGGKPPAPIRKNFDKAVLEELRGAWGSGAFDVSAWPWEPGCDRQVSWRVTAGTDSKIICRDKQAVRKMGELQAKVQALMSGS